uniref:Uncharacterized protein n=1 Tax=Steinernema glaseri TaxID=37863 RepID=A0A1I8ABE2_9BILA
MTHGHLFTPLSMNEFRGAGIRNPSPSIQKPLQQLVAHCQQRRSEHSVGGSGRRRNFARFFWFLYVTSGSAELMAVQFWTYCLISSSISGSERQGYLSLLAFRPSLF